MPELKPGEFTPITLAQMFAWVDEGELALPELQRPAVWKDSQIPELLDSVYRDFPFGTMLVWTPSTSDPIQTRGFRFATAASGTAKHFLIDGQQRLTSFYLALNDKGVVGPDSSLLVAFNVKDEGFSLVDGKVRSMIQNPREHGWYRLRHLLKMQPNELERVKWETGLGDAEFEAIFGETGRLRRLIPDRILITVYDIRGRSYAEAVEIFDRINRGTKVKQSQKVLAGLSAMYPGVVGDVEEYLEASEDKHGGDFDLDFFMGTFALIARDFTELDPLVNFYYDEYDDEERLTQIQTDVRSTKVAIDRAIEFLDRFLGMNTLKYIPSTRGLSCLAYAFSLNVIRADDQKSERRAAHWISRALFIGHYDDNAYYKLDVAALRDCDGKFPFDDLKSNLRSHRVEGKIQDQLSRLNDLDSRISREDLLFAFLYAVMRKSEAVSFPSKKPMKAARLERDEGEMHRVVPALTDRDPTLHRHHIYPLGRLYELIDSVDDGWLTRPMFHDIANLTFILTEDNLIISDQPIEYLRSVEPGVRAQHMIGERDYSPKEYKQLIRDRRKLIQQAMTKYLDALKAD